MDSVENKLVSTVLNRLSSGWAILLFCGYSKFLGDDFDPQHLISRHRVLVS